MGLGDILINDLQSSFLTHQFRQIHREAVSVVKSPYICTSQSLRSVCLAVLGVLLEHALSTIECLRKGHFFFVEDLFDLFLLLLDFWEHFTHLLDQCRHQLREEVANVGVEVLASIACSAAQHTTDDVSSTDIVWHATIRNGECQ